MGLVYIVFMCRRRDSVFGINSNTGNYKSDRYRISRLIKEALNKARSGMKDEVNDILGRQGGNYVPDFGFSEHIEYNDPKFGWNKISKFLNNK